MLTVLATVITAAMPQRITAAMVPPIMAVMLPPIMEGTRPRITTTTHRHIMAIGPVGSFVRPMPTMAALGIMAGGITGGTATIVTGELRKLREQIAVG